MQWQYPSMLAGQSGLCARGQTGSVLARPPPWPAPACPCLPVASALLPCCTTQEQCCQLALLSAAAGSAVALAAAAAVGTLAPAGVSRFEAVNGTGGVEFLHCHQFSHFPGSFQIQVPDWHYGVPPAAHQINQQQ